MRRARNSDVEKFWRRAIERQKASGLTVRQFCAAEGLKDYSLWYWGRRLQAREHVARGSDSRGNRNTPSTLRRTKREKFWTVLLEEWQKSGLSLKEYARRRKVGYKALCRWRRQLLPELSSQPEHNQSRHQKKPTPEFATVRLADEPEEFHTNTSEDIGNVIEIVLKNTRLIRVSSNCSLAFLSRVVSALEDA